MMHLTWSILLVIRYFLVIILQNKTLDIIGRELVTWRETTVMCLCALSVVTFCYGSQVMSPRCRDVSLGLSPGTMVTKECHSVGKSTLAMPAFMCWDVIIFNCYTCKSNERERKITLVYLQDKKEDIRLK